MTENMLITLSKELDFPQESLGALKSAYLSVTENADANKLFQTACENLLQADQLRFNDAVAKLLELTDLPQYTLNILLCVAALEPLQEKYAAAGRLESFRQYRESVKQTMLQCKEHSGIWGIQTAFWQWMFHDWRCAELGRLLFEPYHHFCDVFYRGIQKGDPVVLIHIPAGKPLDSDEVMASLARGYQYFKDSFPNEVVPFITHTWLLYPPYLNGVFPEGSNLQKFAKLFTILAQDDKKYANFSNVFGCDYPGDENLNSLPQETSLQRNMLRFIKEGNSMGDGYGILLYGKDGIIR